jgi:arylformamidase
MTIIDISRTLNSEMTVWPGDSPLRLTRIMNLDAGDSVNLTTLKMSAHLGTHLDAPLHFSGKGQSVTDLDLGQFWGPAQVTTVAKHNGPLFPKDLQRYDLSLAPRLLVRSLDSSQHLSEFPSSFPYPSPELADYLGEIGIVLYGSDAPSMDAVDSKELKGHRALYKHRIAILEWLDLRAAPDGLYELVALPLKIEDGDGSPLRAALRSIS